MSLDTSKRVHFVGIGGAGMSAIAKVLLERGFEVSGSDLKSSRAITMLEAMGARVDIGHDERHVEGAGLVVVSTAIPQSNPESARAAELGIEVMQRGRALAALLEPHRSIIVAGTHGKTTTTSMIVTILRAAGVDPTYLIGAGLNDVGTNARSGTSDVAVAEADESDGSFLWLRPHVAVVTNVEMDHHDRWNDLQELEEAFSSFMSSGDENGTIVVPAEDLGLMTRARAAGRSVTTFGVGGDVAAEEISPGAEGSSFILVCGDRRHEVELRVPGLHNVSDGLTAAAAAFAVGIPADAIARGLNAYRGVERRFQLRGKARGVTVIDDYAHHPTEVRATLAAARVGPWRRVVAVFQPHRYSRTAALFEDFGASFQEADRIVLMDVYGAGEEPVPGVTGKLIADAACVHLPGRSIAYFPHRSDLLGYLVSSVRPGDALLTLGAGDVTTVGDELLDRLATAS
jgi:UDP-N-acetylmuramate--alanine ligase